jgi:hypothetical protein
MSDDAKKIWVTLSGLPLTFDFEWPFHRSTSGADFWVLHGDIRIVSTELHALVAVNLSATVREILPSLEPKDAEAPVINALRKEVDRKQIEFAKSGKLLPVAFSSRHYDFKRQKWVFGKAADDVIATFLERKVYWQTKVSNQHSGSSAQSGASGRGGEPFGGGGGPEGSQVPHCGFAPVRNDINDDSAGILQKIWIGDPTEAQYLETTPAHVVDVASRLVAGEGLFRMDGEWAEATSALMEHGEKFESAMRKALEELDKKHAFERG